SGADASPGIHRDRRSRLEPRARRGAAGATERHCVTAIAEPGGKTLGGERRSIAAIIASLPSFAPQLLHAGLCEAVWRRGLVRWLGFGDASKIVLIFIGCLLPVTLSAFNGARGTEEVLIWSARSMGASRFRVLWEVVLPSALPELLSGIRTALALSFVLLVS